jgi:[ribosomal protein S18]-alanine N-acetyltransferase
MPENLEIRPMSAGDVSRVMEIAANLPALSHWPESAYMDALNSEAARQRIALVAVVTGKVEGFAVASLLAPQAELESIAVTAESQRSGLGRRLFDRLIREVCGAGTAEIILEVRASNAVALAFYRSAGFSQTGLRLGYYVDPIEDAVLMRLQIP